MNSTIYLPINIQGMTFKNIAINGAGNAIVLNITGVLGGLTVTDDGIHPLVAIFPAGLWLI